MIGLEKERAAPVFSAYVANLGKYNENDLIQEELRFPTTTEEVQGLLKRIGVDGVRYESILITEFSSSVPGLTKNLGEYESIDELNHLAHVLSELSPDEWEKFMAVAGATDRADSAAGMINLAQNLDCYEVYPDIQDEESLGRYYLESLPIPAEIRGYVDYEQYGRDAIINEDGTLTPEGYVLYGGDFKEYYHGEEDIPAEHKVFSYPQLSTREQMAAYQEVADKSITEKKPPGLGHDDR